MAIRSTGICPIHLVLNKRNRSFSRISMTAIAVPMAVAHGNRQTVMQLQEENGK